MEGSEVSKVKQTKMLGPACCSNPPVLNSFSGAGHVAKLGGFDAYLTGSPLCTFAILLVSDIFGTVLLPFLLIYVAADYFEEVMVSYIECIYITCLTVLFFVFNQYIHLINFTCLICFVGYKAPILRYDDDYQFSRFQYEM